MIKVGIIGCGNISKRYSEVLLNEIPDVTVVAVCDLSVERAKMISGLFGSNYYVEVDKFLANEDMDLVFILSNSGLHYEHCRKSLSHGIHTITEKPITLKINHANELRDIADKKGLMYGVVFQNRYNKALQQTWVMHQDT